MDFRPSTVAASNFDHARSQQPRTAANNGRQTESFTSSHSDNGGMTWPTEFTRVLKDEIAEVCSYAGSK